MRTAIARAFTALLLVVTFVVALAGGALLHVGAPPVRRIVASRVSALLKSTFKGVLSIDAIGALGFHGVSGVRAHVDDPSGARLLTLEGVSAKIDAVDAVRSVLHTSRPIAIDITTVTVFTADVDVLGVDDTGGLRLAKAFELAKPSAPSTTPGRGVSLTIGSVAIEHVRVHGTLTGGVDLDCDIAPLEGEVLVTPSKIAIDVDRFELIARGLPLGATARGKGEVHVTLPSPKGAALGVTGTWVGAVADIPCTATAVVDGLQVDATFDAPAMGAEAIRALWPASPIDHDASAHAEVHGTSPKFDVAVKSGLGESTLDAKGAITLGDRTHVDVTFETRELDLHSFELSAPETRLDGDGHIAGDFAKGQPVAGDVTLTVQRGFVAGQRIPRTRVIAKITGDAARGVSVNATLDAHEPGIDAAFSIEVTNAETAPKITWRGDVRAPQLGAIQRVRIGATGDAHVTTRGSLDPTKGVVAASLEGTVGDLAIADTRWRSTTVSATIQGKLTAPRIDLTMHAQDCEIADTNIQDVRFELHGPATDAKFHAIIHEEKPTHIEATGDIAIGSFVVSRNIDVSWKRSGEHMQVHVDEVMLKGGELIAEGVQVDGFGAPIHASFHSNQGQIDVKADARGIDLARVSRALGIEKYGIGGRLLLDVDASLWRDHADAQVEIELADGAFEDLDAVSGRFDGSVRGRRVAASLIALVGDVGAVRVTTHTLEMGGDEPLASSWKRLWGDVEIDVRANLAKLAPKLPQAKLPFGEIAGEVTAHARVLRDSMSDGTPGVDFTASTKNLVLTGKPNLATPEIAPWRSEGVDASVTVAVDGDTGKTSVNAQVTDPHGPLVTLAATTPKVDYGAFLEQPARAKELAEALAVQARINVPARKMEELPPALVTKGAHGEVQAAVAIRGTARAPVVEITASAKGARASRAGIALPLDVAITGQYDGSRLYVAAAGRANDHDVLVAQAQLLVRATDVLDLDGPFPWSATARAHLADFPLESLRALSDAEVRGSATGDLELKGLHDDASATATLDVKDLAVGDVLERELTMKASIDGKALDAQVHLDQGDGFGDVKAHVASSWGAAIAPTLDPTQPLDVNVTTNRLRAGVAMPFVQDQFTELDGRLDSFVHLTLDPRTRTAKANGQINLSQGRFELATIGGEFHDATAKIVLTPDGVVRFEDVKARGMSGRVGMAATVRLDGFRLAGVNAEVVVPSSDPLPLAVEGSELGTIDGRLVLTATTSPDRKTLSAKLDVPSFHVQLPLAPPHDAQPLGALGGVKLVATKGGKGPAEVNLDRRAKAAATAAAPAQATAIQVEVTLGKDVEVRRGNEMKIALSGKPTITVTDKTRVTGQIRLDSGTLAVQGKSFDIESGTITFVGDDPQNPQCVVTASWTAGDGTKVYADFVGPLKTGTVTLRSEPPLAKNEILALLIFGTPDGMGGASGGGTSASGSATPGGDTAIGAAGGAATAPVNTALEQFGLGGVSTRVDTSSPTPRPEVEFQIARDVSLQVAWALGTPPPGTNPDRTLLTLDWRFVRRWSLETTVGDAGTSIFDLIWNMRY